MTAVTAARRTTAGGEAVIFLAAFSWAAAAVHAVVAVPHLEEYPLFGVAFAVLAVVQAAWAVRLYRRCDRRALLGAIALNVAVLLVWALSRTTGLPLGPEAGSAEAVGFPDVGASVDELALIVLAESLLRGRSETLGPWARQSALVVLIFCGLALMTAGHAHG